MINVNCENQRVYLFEKDGLITGSILVSGGKDAQGNKKDGSFMRVRFSNEQQDYIWSKTKGQVPKEASLECSGFLTTDTYKDNKSIVYVVTKITKFEDIKDGPLPTTRKRGSNNG